MKARTTKKQTTAATKKAIRPGWSTEVRKKKYKEIDSALWKRVSADLRDVGPDTFEEAGGPPWAFHEVLNKGEKYVLIYSRGKSKDSLYVVEFAGDPVAEYDAFFKVIFDKVAGETIGAYD